jgi:effector-binding domain-containing protein
MAEHGIEVAAQPMAITRIGEQGRYEVEAAIPATLPASLPALASRVRVGHSPAGRAVRVVHRGPYERMGPTYEKLAAWIAAHALEEGQVSWEQYISDPGVTPEHELITHIYFRIGDEG